MSTASRAVFLSYASEDAPAAQRIAEALRSAGVEVWFDREELRGGDVWDQRIRQQIRDCRLFVPIISAHTEGRLEGYFRREWKLAVDRTDDMATEVAFLVPVVIDDTPNASAHVPERFRHVQWTRLQGGEATPAFVGLISKLLTPTSSSNEASKEVQRASDTTATVQAQAYGLKAQVFRRRTAVIAGACLIVVAALGYFGYDRFSHTGFGAAAPAQATPAADKSIAVLPFVDLSEKHDQEYLADGMAEEILGLLAKLPELKVIGRTSSFSFKGKQTDLSSIGKILGVAYVVEGSIRRIDDHIRVAAQLVDARNGSHRWSETYDGSTTDVLRLQDEIALRVTRALDLQLGGGEALPSRYRSTLRKPTNTTYAGYESLQKIQTRASMPRTSTFRNHSRWLPNSARRQSELPKRICLSALMRFSRRLRVRVRTRPWSQL